MSIPSHRSDHEVLTIWNIESMKNSLLLSLLVVLLSNCQKDTTLVPAGQYIPGNITWLFAPESETAHLLSLPVSGMISIGNHSFHHNQTTIPGESISIGGYIQDQDGIPSDFGTFAINGGTASIEAEAFQNQFGYSQLIGQSQYVEFYHSTNSYSLEGNPGRNLPGFHHEQLYFPDAMIISSPPTQSGVGPGLEIGSTITWNADPDNPNGIAVVIELDPIDNMENKDLISPVQPIIKNIYVPDHGQLILTEEMMKDFPEHAILRIQLGRGSYRRIISNSSTQSLIVGVCNYTTQGFTFTFQNL